MVVYRVFFASPHLGGLVALGTGEIAVILSRSLYLAVGLLFLPSVASSLTIDAADRGIFFASGSSNNPGASNGVGTGNGFRGYYVFDLATLAGVASGALLEIELFDYNADASETFGVYRYDDPAALGVSSLQTATDFATSIFHFTDLGDGVRYGGATVTAADIGSVLSISLDAAALADINSAAGGLFALGVAIETGDIGADTLSFSPFSGGSVVQRLELTVVPEPGTALLLGVGIAGIGVGRRRSSQC